MTTDALALLMSGGSIGAQFPAIGHEYSGTIVSIGQPRQQTDLQSGKPKFFDDGTTPRMQVPITLATSARGKYVREDQSSPWELVDVADDDGSRTLWVAADMQRAIRDAVVKARNDYNLTPSQLPGPEVGGHLTVTRGKNKPKVKAGWSGQHTFTAVYVPKAQNAGAAAVMEDRDPFTED